MVVRGVLRFLGGIVVAFLVLGAVLGVGGYFALRNFNPNMFRADLEKYLTQQTGYRVELGDIRLEWHPQPQLQVDGLKFYQPKTLEKLLQSDQVRIDADLTSLWQKHLSVSQAVIQSPEIFLKRDRQGVWNWLPASEPPVAAVAAAPMLAKFRFIPVAEAAEGSGSLSMKSIASVTQGWEFRLGKILVRDATVHFADETIEPPFLLDIESLEIEVRQKSAASTYHFTSAGAMFDSAKKNLEAEGDLDLVSKALDLTLRYGPEKAEFRGMLKVINTMPHFEGTLEIRDLDMESVIPEAYKRGQYVSGRLSTKAQISLDGANPAILQRSLKGQGTTGIMDGALRNRNVIKEVFDQLSPVMAITNALGGQLPPELSEMLKDRDTPFESLQVAYDVASGVGKVREFRLTHPNYQLSGKGTYGILDKRVDGSMELLLSRSISAFLIQKIHELGMIADRSGQVMIPFRYSGVFPDTRVQPDLPYIAQRMLQGGADQFLSQGLEKLSKIMGPKKTASAASGGTVTPPATGTSSGTSSGTSAPEATKPVSQQDQWIQEGLKFLNQIQEPKKQ